MERSNYVTRPVEQSHATSEAPAYDLPIWREAFAGMEWLSLRLSPTFAGFGVAHGDGSPVIAVPGLLCSDLATAEMRGWLDRMGYRAYPSAIGRIACCPVELSDDLALVVEAVAAETGRRVHLAGHSLGGLIARGAALRRPSDVASVTTLGTPAAGVRVHPYIESIGRAVGAECTEKCISDLQRRLPHGVVETAIYSRSDGIVDWRTCAAPGARRIEVPGTHSGMIVNPAVYRALAGILAQPQRRKLTAVPSGAPEPAATPARSTLAA